MDSIDFARRLSYFRDKANVSAREMSLSIGQNAAYISYIENGKSMPSMEGFFNICEYLKITPAEFFFTANEDSKDLTYISENLHRLSPQELANIAFLVRKFCEK